MTHSLRGAKILRLEGSRHANAGTFRFGKPIMTLAEDSRRSPDGRLRPRAACVRTRGEARALSTRPRGTTIWIAWPGSRWTASRPCNHPALTGALKAQGERLWHVSNIFTHSRSRRRWRRSSDRHQPSPTWCFFTNSGTEAVECALKTARKFHTANGNPERIDVIGFEGAFHGRSYAAVNAAGNPGLCRWLRPAGCPAMSTCRSAITEALKAADRQPDRPPRSSSSRCRGRAAPAPCRTACLAAPAQALCDAHVTRC